ncbi:hypothetical protein G6F50_016452 [Rhizopus delemar]|uniref:Uncharacterized protein n=1 Tax=Rhizopus delemar TaxID=936053 RepID=A0A9P6XTL4_9FUNG|nr:hypothetical protein G6F50_016452 [Rhizopus delemar]
MALTEVICDRPAISENCRSSGCATLDAIVSGLPPGRLACTWIVGKSTCGNGATGSSGQAAIPTSRIASASSDVPMGRLMKLAEMLISHSPPRPAPTPPPARAPCCPASACTARPPPRAARRSGHPG